MKKKRIEQVYIMYLKMISVRTDVNTRRFIEKIPTSQRNIYWAEKWIILQNDNIIIHNPWLDKNVFDTTITNLGVICGKDY